jgi:hypothetical protein
MGIGQCRIPLQAQQRCIGGTGAVVRLHKTPGGGDTAGADYGAVK